MSELTVLILCGRSPRHLYVANRLCKAAVPLAIVQETGREWTGRKVSRVLQPANLWSKISRRVRNGKHDRGAEEAKFFFGNQEPRLTRPELVVEVPYINHPQVSVGSDCTFWALYNGEPN